MPIQYKHKVTVEYARSYLITQQNFLKQQEQKLRTLLGFDVSQIGF